MELVLEDTTLTMIVRDEENNPAGGIGSNLPIILPHVKEAVVVDTGSVDNTLRILRRLKGKFPNLRIYERPFDGFASSRNYSLSKVKTEKALVLDADELLTAEDFRKISDFIKLHKFPEYDFSFDFLYPDGNYRYFSPLGRFCGETMTTRLFDVRGAEFRPRSEHRDCFEELYHETPITPKYIPVQIKHFFSSHSIRKGEQWYENNSFLTQQPLKNAQKNGWKDFNGWRRLFGNGEKNLEYESFHKISSLVAR